ncbi:MULTISPECIES: carboxymuconolactone decarboxylase family protein [unclassified Lysobacter]|uniref:carboxymuconolactone decarboxylase family protein n=1 Tax=unclassified Lysobacter TaxID=2635362 RepID=UPI001BE4ED95|nr:MULTISPECIES: carboxymuconolactone decarboxylase family protein [unclassified Lysobacter]MBT2746505.1 carboxymuconolactone decarboxylase family protein [Lysobacter sp. ISL-42]MBT2753007.1 carboxymuconolactone decarboxylase family protein [Lysobacter sp. ISL-50]MBT2777684.1 carboxymuconolactone decarboxylase family protein [Lysobacter sp. ISL-54]MBT2782455.1 carboxymuconolactone decarboxylase family protein [Lysobacter sp. ISL-52]
MSQGLDYQQQSPELFKKLIEFSMLTDKSSIERPIHDLVSIRASQINGCAFCVDMHIKQATLHGERPLRLHHLATWRESTLFAPRERAALAWTEVLTQIPAQGVSDEIYERVRTQLSEKEMSDLSFVVMNINAWNRVNVGFQTVPGSLDKAFGLDKANLA